VLVLVYVQVLMQILVQAQMLVLVQARANQHVFRLRRS
jgi:hypothetical protein